MQPKLKYIPLSPSSTDSDDFVNETQAMLGHGDNDIKPSRSSASLKWNILATWMILICTVLNVTVYFLSSPSGGRDGLAKPLRRPNQFIGLDTLPYNRTLLTEDMLSLTTFPTFIHQVDRTKPREVLPSSGKLVFTMFGSISPERRLFLVTEEMYTIVQFRARDYGMERCQIELALPEEFDSPGSKNGSAVHSESDRPMLEHEHQYQHQSSHNPKEQTWRLSGDTHGLEVWTLDTADWLDLSTLSYSTLPRKMERLGALSVHPGAVARTRRFGCKSDEIVSVVLFCVGKGCRVEGWQDTGKPVVGLSLKQHSSL